MRKFYINDKELFVTDVSGLGLNYDDNLSANFDDITLKVHFGFNDSAYKEYASLSNHLFALKGTKFALQYTFEDKTLKCLCELKTLTKSQKDHFNIMNENLILKRLSYWYEEVEHHFMGGSSGALPLGTYDGEEPIPIKFLWVLENNEITAGTLIHNQIYDYQGGTLLRTQEIEITEAFFPTWGQAAFVIDAETRQVYFRDYGGPIPMASKYDALARDKDRFLYLEKGYNLLWILSTAPTTVNGASVIYKKVVF